MNNLFPSDLKMHCKFDLKGSTYKRKASRKEREKASPTYKDLDFMEMYPDGIYLQPEIHNCLMDTIVRDCRALESLKIMDYSLLMGIHNIDQGRNFKAVHRGRQEGSRSYVITKKAYPLLYKKFYQQKKYLVKIKIKQSRLK